MTGTTGVMQLGYLCFEVSDLGAWEALATDVLGLEVSGRPDGGLALRMDGHRQRFLLQPGPADDLCALGLQVADEAALSAMTARLRGAGVAVSEGAPGERAARQVRGLIRTQDPVGTPIEIFYGPALAETPFRSQVVRAGFVADGLGLGHVVVSARSQRESLDFYCQVLGLRLSDRIVAEIHGFKVDIVFVRANARHHSIAIGALGDLQRQRIHHFMLEARAMDEVGLCFDRALRAGVKIMQTLGRHPNDRMFSFYACTPSGFHFEFGWGGREVDDARWESTTYDHISEWGHHPPALLHRQARP